MVATGVVVVLAGAVLWMVWGAPTTRGNAIDVVIIGDSSVVDSRDELERRFRQEGMVPLVVEVAAADCADAADHFEQAHTVILSFSDWTACDDGWDVDRRVQQPGGEFPVGGETRPAAPLFNGDEREVCLWWDTPGAGEARPGLGRCEPDGTVAVMSDGQLTDAGRERFARLVVAATYGDG